MLKTKYDVFPPAISIHPPITQTSPLAAGPHWLLDKNTTLFTDFIETGSCFVEKMISGFLSDVLQLLYLNSWWVFWRVDGFSWSNQGLMLTGSWAWRKLNTDASLRRNPVPGFLTDTSGSVCHAADVSSPSSRLSPEVPGAKLGTVFPLVKLASTSVCPPTQVMFEKPFWHLNQLCSLTSTFSSDAT